MSSDNQSEAEVFLDVVGVAGVITLNRPKALNALTQTMVRAIDPVFRAWQRDPSIKHIIIRQTGEKAFCAGGDIRAMHDAAKAGEFDGALGFYGEEYVLNTMIKRTGKPYIALLDGIVMGGGVGLSVHGTHRVVSEKVLFAMPEVGIGFFPDVGGTYFLPRLPGRIGTYLALTGERLKAADVLYAGIGTHFVPSAKFPALFDALTQSADVEATLAHFSADPGPAPLKERRAAIDRLFAGDTALGILQRIEAAASEGDALAQGLRDTLRARSPTSVALTFRQILEGAKLEFEACMQLEYRIVSRVLPEHDFVEGVRAVIIDKDQAPQWQPARLEDVSSSAIDAYFAPLPKGDLVLS